MRIVSWNCCQAFRKKWEYVAAFDPDVIVVPESECIERQPAALLERYPTQAWVGDNPSKGLLILGNAEHPIEIMDSYNPEHRYVVPLRVSGVQELALVAVWTQRDKTVGYTQHLSRALAEYETLLDGKPIVIGDFNANTIWDQEHRRDITHSQNVAWLHDRGMVSAYHALMGETQGGESTATHAFRWNADNTFHIDYAFVSKRLLDDGVTLTVPPVAEWLRHSDHGPLVLDLGV